MPAWSRKRKRFELVLYLEGRHFQGRPGRACFSEGALARSDASEQGGVCAGVASCSHQREGRWRSGQPSRL